MKIRVITLAVLSATLLVPASLHADGGVVCLRQASGPFRVTVFTTPAALRVGAADFSVMVQDRKSNAIMLDAAVDLKFEPQAAGGSSIEISATRRQATNKLLKSALVDFPSAGVWTLAVTVRRDGSGRATFTTRLRVAPPLPRIAAIWPFLILPLLAVLGFAAHRVLQGGASCQAEDRE
jgi:hypothetical protein